MALTESQQMAQDVLERTPEGEREQYVGRLTFAAAARDARLRYPPSWLTPYLLEGEWDRLPSRVKKFSHKHPRDRAVLEYVRARRSDGEEEDQTEGEASQAASDDRNAVGNEGKSNAQSNAAGLPPLP